MLASAHARALERIARLCHDHDDARTLRIAVIDELRRAVGFDAYAWLLTDPETEVGCAPLADVPWLGELPAQIRLKYLTAVNRWTHLDVPAALLRTATAGQRDRSVVWRDLLARYAVEDAASVVFRDRFGCWAFLELWRIDPATGFTDADLAFLTAVAEPVTHALRRCQARTFDLAATTGERVGPAVLVLSPGLEVRAQTAETDAFLRLLVPPDAGREPIPAGAYNVAAQLLATESGVDDHPPLARVHLAGGRWLTLRAARIGGTGHGERDDIAVTIESTSPHERLGLYARACGLSARETELLTHLTTGADSRAVAERMHVSAHTVQDHLKSMFEKTGVRSRRALVTRAVGH